MLVAAAVMVEGFPKAETIAAPQGPPVVQPRAHAHNDYEHARPLLDALAFGFCSVDADIWLVGGELPVGSTLITLDGDYAELRLQPAGTILRIAENTNFTVNGLQGREGATKSTFTVGNVRIILACM